MAFTAPREARWHSTVALIKLIVLCSAILFAPVFGLYHAWSKVVGVSARHVFADELFSYSPVYSPPHLWHDVPFGVRCIVLLALFVVALAPVRSWQLRHVLLSLAVIVIAVQGVTLARVTGVAPMFVERGPRPFYLEYYITPLYAVTAAYVLTHAELLLSPPARLRILWPVKMAAVAIAGWFIAGVVPLWGPLSLRTKGNAIFRRATHACACIAVITLVIGAFLTWRFWPPEGIHFFRGSLSTAIYHSLVQRSSWPDDGCRHQSNHRLPASTSRQK